MKKYKNENEKYNYFYKIFTFLFSQTGDAGAFYIVVLKLMKEVIKTNMAIKRGNEAISERRWRS